MPYFLILEANSKRPISKERKEIGNKVKLVEQVEWTYFFSFLTKIFHNIQLPFLYFQNNYRRHCLLSMPTVSNKIKFKRKAFVEFFIARKKKLCAEKLLIFYF